jgi:hypothetical protein
MEGRRRVERVGGKDEGMERRGEGGGGGKGGGINNWEMKEGWNEKQKQKFLFFLIS